VARLYNRCNQRRGDREPITPIQKGSQGETLWLPQESGPIKKGEEVDYFGSVKVERSAIQSTRNVHNKAKEQYRIRIPNRGPKGCFA